MAYGYRWGEVKLAKLGPIKQTACIILPREVDLSVRPPIAVDIGIAVDGHCCPHPDPQDPWTTVAGVVKRFACRPPDAETALLSRLKGFVSNWVQKNLIPLSPDSDTSFESWLEATSYPLWRKEELRVKWAEVEDVKDERYHRCESFMKDEWYMEFKHARAINSRTDEFKCYAGPIFKLIEEQLYQDHHFIKHIPVVDRPQYIHDLLYREGGTYYSSDYTSFEALFTPALMDSVEFVLYDYMVQNLPGGEEWAALMRQVLAGPNRTDFRDFRAFVDGTRMSGDMCTSLGNGFANLMIMLFVCTELKGCTDVDGVVEGDDGLFAMNGEAPTETDFRRLGLLIKLETHVELSTASFCGLIFDEQDLLTITDPRDVMVTFGWASGRYSNSKQKTLDALLRCKALSLAHQYPGCPILSALAEYGLRITAHIPRCKMLRVINARKAMSGWERDELLAALKDEKKIRRVQPPLRTRLLVERVYGITVEEQINTERALDAMLTPGPIPVQHIEHHFPDCWSQMYEQYVQQPSDLRRPALPAVNPRLDELFETCATAPVTFHGNRWRMARSSKFVGLVPRALVEAA